MVKVSLWKWLGEERRGEMGKDRRGEESKEEKRRRIKDRREVENND